MKATPSGRPTGSHQMTDSGASEHIEASRSCYASTPDHNSIAPSEEGATPLQKKPELYTGRYEPLSTNLCLYILQYTLQGGGRTVAEEA